MSAPMPAIGAALLVLAAAAFGSAPTRALAAATVDTPAPVMKAAASDVPERYLIGDLRVTRPRVEGDPSQTAQASAYVEIENRGDAADRLVGASVDLAGRTTLSTGTDAGPGAAGSLTIPPRGTLDMKPGGPRLVLAGVRSPLKEGDRLKGSLRFERAGSLPIEFTVGGAEGGAAAKP